MRLTRCGRFNALLLVAGLMLASQPGCSGKPERQRETENVVEAVGHAAVLFHQKTGAWPRSQREMVPPQCAKDCLLERVQSDAWGHEIQISPVDGGVEIRSLGPSGAPGAADNIFRRFQG